jgi:hypothetical protein
MYEALEHCASDIMNLQETVKLPDSAARLAAIVAVLRATAGRVSEVAAADELERDRLGKIYRGLLAASRVVDRFSEQQAQS